MKPISNFHTHTRLCRHAEGEPSDYARQAAREGCTALGFSDHCPYPESFSDVWPDIRMSTDDAAEYSAQVGAAKEGAPFPVYQGYECEWDASFGGWYDDLKGSYGADYLVLGSHWVTLGSRHEYIPNVDSPYEMNKYIDQTISGMQSGHFAFLAHPDIFMAGIDVWDGQTEACSRAIIDAAHDLGLPLEINGLGIIRRARNTNFGMRYPYPFVEFWELAAAAGVRVICNSDAHRPGDVILNAWRARDFAGRFSITPLETLPFCTG